MSIFYGILFLFIGIFMPYFPVWLKASGMSESDLGIILAVPMIARMFFAPLLSALADHYQNWRFILVILCWSSVILMGAIAFQSNFWLLLCFTLVFGSVWTSILPLAETIAMQGVRRDNLHYGKARLWGSLAFILAGLVFGYLLDLYGARILMPGLLVTLIMTAMAAWALPEYQPHEAKENIGKIQQAANSKGETREAEQRLENWYSFKPISILLQNRVFLLFVFSAGLLQATHALYYGFSSLHWKSQGFSGLTIGLLWAIGVLAEILLFWFAAEILQKWHAINLLLIAGLAASLRWGLMGLDPPLVLLFPLQCLHALTFGAAHLGSVYFISRYLEDHCAGTGQGVYAAFSMGFAMGLATLASGILYKILNGQAYLIMAFLALISVGGLFTLSAKNITLREVE